MALFSTSTFAFCVSINVDFSHIVNYLKQKTSTTVHRLYLEALNYFTKTPLYVPAAEMDNLQIPVHSPHVLDYPSVYWHGMLGFYFQNECGFCLIQPIEK